MDSVFKKYNVYEDVADIIAREVHKGNLQEITNKIKRIKIMNDFKSFVGELYVMDYKDEFCEDEDDTIINFTDMLIDTFVDYKVKSKDISDEILLHGASWMDDIDKNRAHGLDENEIKYQQSCIYGYLKYLQEEENEFMSKVYDNFFNDMNQE